MALTALGAFSAVTNAAADYNLDQCANGGVGAPPQVCTGAQWVNGNLNQSKAHYAEGQSIPYRARFTGLTPGGTVHQLVIQWDTT
jgi:hypothetical protein